MEKILHFGFFVLLLCTSTIASKSEFNLNKQVYALNDVIKISYTNVPVNKHSWIGIWRADNIEDGPWHQKQSKSSEYWEYTTQESGQLVLPTLKSNLAPGRYAAFLLSENGYKWLSNPIIFDIADSRNQIKLKTLALNIWHEGIMVPDGFNGIVNELLASGADVILLSEVKNYNGDFMKRLVDAMNLKGFNFHTHHSASDVGVLSRFPIQSHQAFNNYFTKILIDINNVTAVFYNCHLDYLYYAPYLYRGYEFGKGKLPKPETDVGKILAESNRSNRLSAMKVLTNDAKKEISMNRVVTISGDFNEPSPLDYTYETRNMYEHNGVIIPWNTTNLLYKLGFKDAYRVKYPDPVKYPGITWPSDNGNKDVKKIIDVPVDVRDRIDYTFYYPDRRLTFQDVIILGPSTSVARYQRVKETGLDKFMRTKGEWPSDHKGVLVTFSIGKRDGSNDDTVESY